MEWQRRWDLNSHPVTFRRCAELSSPLFPRKPGFRGCADHYRLRHVLSHTFTHVGSTRGGTDVRATVGAPADELALTSHAEMAGEESDGALDDRSAVDSLEHVVGASDDLQFDHRPLFGEALRECRALTGRDRTIMFTMNQE